MSILVRRATTTDVRPMLDLVAAYWRFERIGDFDPATVGAQLARLLGDERLGAGWLALRDGVPAGYLLAVFVFSLEHRGLTAEIDEFFVLREARGNDVGRAFYTRHGYSARGGFDLLEKTLTPGGSPS